MKPGNYKNSLTIGAEEIHKRRWDETETETDLRLVGEPEREPGDGERRVVDEGVVDALGPEEAREDAAVGGEAGERDPGVLGDAEDLALVRGELGGGLVDGGEDGVGAGPEADADGALLDGLHGVLDLEEPPLRAPRRHVGVVLVPKHLRRLPPPPMRLAVRGRVWVLGLACGFVSGLFSSWAGGRRGLVGPVWQWRRTGRCAAARRALPSLFPSLVFLLFSFFSSKLSRKSMAATQQQGRGGQVDAFRQIAGARATTTT
jgi:hypothetical protein